MTSWPWMKDVDEALTSKPMDPVDKYDKREIVADLINEHQAKISKIRDGVSDHKLFNPCKHDDLWLLRFWLSHKKSAAAIKAAKVTLDLRDKYRLDDVDIRDIPPHQVTTGPMFEYQKYCTEDAIHLTLPDPKRGVIAFLRMAGFDNKDEMVAAMTEEEWTLAFLYCSEWTHQWADYVTRTTGRLTKSVRFINLTGISLATGHREGARRDGVAMGVMEDCYPQMLDTLFICNAPALFQVLWRFVRPLMPTRVVKKMDMINPASSEKERKRVFPHISEENLPTLFGGKNETPYTKM